MNINNCIFLYKVSNYDDLKFSVRFQLEDWEVDSRNVFKELSERANTILDIGAYTGLYTLIALKANNDVKVIAFEPNLKLASVLKENLEINNLSERARICTMAASNVNGNASLYSGIGGTSVSTLLPSGAYLADVQTIRLDDVLKTEQIDVIKMDIEGGELLALTGAEETIRRCKPFIIVESLNDFSTDALKSLLGKHGYLSPMVLDERNLLFSPN